MGIPSQAGASALGVCRDWTGGSLAIGMKGQSKPSGNEPMGASTAALLNSAVRDNLLHVAGTVGFTRTPSATVGIEPSMGYFVGSTFSSGRIIKGSAVLSTAGTVVSFSPIFAAAPSVVLTIASTTPNETHAASVYNVTTTGFSWLASVAGNTWHYIVFGA
jgi:hypothetical protein